MSDAADPDDGPDDDADDPAAALAAEYLTGDRAERREVRDIF